MKSVYYHGCPSPLRGDVLRAGTYVSPSYNIAYQMGRFHLDTNQTWTDDDLIFPYNFEGEPTFKKNRVPEGIPLIYVFSIEDGQLNKLNNPYEHTTTTENRIARTR